jgi:NAD(P)-dependent dehydrogenase (short-subunit alcohol dehydrogenase family)
MTTTAAHADRFSLAGKVAVVTGGAGGVGEAFLTGLSDAGASVVVADIDAERAASVAKRFTEEGRAAMSVGFDQSDQESIASMVSQVSERFGGIDILVNNAALMAGIPRAKLIEFPIDWWERVLRVNLTGVLMCVQAVAPQMIERGGGRIVSISSGGAFAIPGNAYTISKLGVAGVTIGLARELAPHNITVNAIAPGAVETDAGFRSAPPGSPSREYLSKAAPLRASSPPEDLVGALLLLVSPAGNWITGQTLHVDGGWIMQL